MSSNQAYEQDGSAIDCKERTDAVELGGKDLQDHECEGELREGRSDVGALERPLRCTDLDQLRRRENDRPSAMISEVITVRSMHLTDVSTGCLIYISRSR